jgi:hypothetical protein
VDKRCLIWFILLWEPRAVWKTGGKIGRNTTEQEMEPTIGLEPMTC